MAERAEGDAGLDERGEGRDLGKVGGFGVEDGGRSYKLVSVRVSSEG